MRRNLKVLGLALVAVFAMSALSVANASAAGEKFHASEEHVIVTGDTHEGNPTLGIGNVKIVCEKGHYEGTVTGTETPGTGKFTSEEVTVHPTYEGCKIGTLEAKVNTNGCNYVLTSPTMVTTTEPVTTEHATTRIECTTGKQIVISGAGCEVKIGTGGEGNVPHETLNDGVKYANKNTGHEEVTVTATVKHIPWESKGAFCPFVGLPNGGKEETAVYEDKVTVKAFEDKTGPCTQNSTTHKLETCTEGNQVNISWG